MNFDYRQIWPRLRIESTLLSSVEYLCAIFVFSEPLEMIKSIRSTVSRLNHWYTRFSAARRGFGVYRRRRFQSTVRNRCEGEILETRVLPAISGFQVAAQESSTPERYVTNMTWSDDRVTSNTSYEVWVDQLMSTGHRNSRVSYVDDIPATGNQVSFQPDQDFVAGNYIAWVRRHDPHPTGGWHRVDFQIDDDGNSATPLPEAVTPERSVVSVVRPGQAAALQLHTESSIGWTGDVGLYDVWVDQRNASGAWQPYSLIRNVPTRSISYRQLANAAVGFQYQFYGQIDHDSSGQLESGDYRFFVRGVNAAVDTSGNWVGRGWWSPPVEFSYRQIEGSNAVPANLTATDELRPTIRWDAVDGADAYLVQFSRSGKPTIYLRLNGTSYTPSAPVLQDWNNSAQISPGDRWSVRVRGLSQDGSPVGFASGNFASTTFTVPRTLTAQNLPAPIIIGPESVTSDQTPVLRWDSVGNAENYEVWFSSMQTGSRAFLATEVTHNALHLHPEILEQYVSQAINPDVYSTDSGLAEGQYRFWVRAHSGNVASAWSTDYFFTVDRSKTMTVQLGGTGNVAEQPLLSVRYLLEYEQDGRQFLLMANGRGETFGTSVLARFEVGDDGIPFRPVIASLGGGTQLEFPDLEVGTNVTAMSMLPNGRVVVLTRGSGELHVVDPATWQLQFSLPMLDISNNESYDAINMEVLDNGQVLVVYSRQDRLRVFDIDDVSSVITEVDVRAPGDSRPGFHLVQGSSVQVKATPLGDGTFRLFMSMPAIHSITVHHYDPVQKTLTDAVDSAGDSFAVTRSGFAVPFVAGHVQSIAAANDSEQAFFFGADRNGFVTWINTETLQSGFLDMADFIPDVSRDANAENYANPNDNSFDATRIVGVDDDHVAVFNNRQSSVIMKLVMQNDGSLRVAASSTMGLEYGGIPMTVASGTKLVAASGTVTVYDLEQNATTQSLEVGASTLLRLGVPVVESSKLGDDLLIKYNGGLRSVIRTTDDGRGLKEVTLPRQYAADTGQVYVLDDGATATHENPVTGQHFVIATGHPQNTSGGDSDHILVLDVTDLHAPELIAAYQIGLVRVRAAIASANEIVLLDRLGGQMLTVSDWQNPTRASVDLYDFHQRLPFGLGRTRPGDAVIMPDGSVAVMHDTVPDRGVSVFATGTATASDRLATFHANNTGTFAFEIESFDNDRVIAVTYGGDVIIQNIRTGAIEADQYLTNANGVDVDVAAVQNQSFFDGVLVVNMPSTETVAVFRVSNDGSNDPATPLRIHNIKNVFATEVDSTGYWIIETGQVHRVSF